jgi:hypothetical protein
VIRRNLGSRRHGELIVREIQVLIGRQLRSVYQADEAIPVRLVQLCEQLRQQVDWEESNAENDYHRPRRPSR